MLPTPPSNAQSYSLVYSRDPALDWPVRVEPSDEEGDKAWKARLADWHQKLSVARSTGDWSPLLKPGQKPTIFHFRQVPGDVWGALQRVMDGLSHLERCALMIRAALVRFEDGFPDHKIERAEHVDTNGKPTGIGQIVTVATTNLLDAIESPAHLIDRGDIILEVGFLAWKRRKSLDPLS